MPHKGTTVGSAVSVPQPFSVFKAKNGWSGVRIGDKRAYASVRQVFITAAPILVQQSRDGSLEIVGEGVVRQEGDTIRVTA